ncbi:5-methyltetrahydropteroyltriglutamate-- homocyste ine methyltransferase [Bifidobacterium lemurum]|uniref:5-methyltetrahydropteroyltriglutamate--homocyste ine methyltransferase n=1 Tax=Bifidobacterium lemurum TaxID=1603886 RepID=A0A261FMB3_9BIFI|nr:5-methyltetrahydropteroyltriglutamate--homocysteine S-methyltransferase [Bifidobacterium lemurum]OZG60287.1 5-methyltetrahydropteroyltriglutamate-- homocyste ine methyltransferase [Bifidobacterium lemurum]QOL34169.1 5-methyltetrahydropteroyltriglutamate--homocysteine S-methyltransferase [Bifidobacterium lemurum]
MTYAKNAPFRADVVGSYLRPAELKDARVDFEAGRIDAAALKEVEDRAIADLVAKQKAAGLKVITDGEFRRSYWHLDFMWGLQGVERRSALQGYMFHDEETRADTAVVTGRIGGENHPFVEHFKFVKALEDDGQVARQTIPAPIQLYSEITLDRAEGQVESLRAVYPDDEALKADVAAAYRQVLADLYAAGCRNVQFDDCTWGIYCDTDFVAKTGMSAVDIEQVSRLGVELNNAAIAGSPEDLVVTTHVCRGNYHSTYAFEGGYDPIAPYLFADENVTAFYLEFDDARSGGFEPLRHVADDKTVVLGLVTSKKPELEDADVIKERIAEAARYVPLERLCLSTQCGFASTEEGNKLTEEQQWAKIALVRSVAAEVWSED